MVHPLLHAIGGGYDIWGFEIDEEFYKKAQERINIEMQQIDLWEVMNNETK